MFNLMTLIYIFEVLLITIPALFSVAFVTIAERKTMASMQRRLGPNIVGYYGLLQAFADALKLVLKEYVSPTQANIILFFLGPIITLIFSLLGYAVIPYGSGLYISDFSLGILYLLAVSSLSTYGILLTGCLNLTAIIEAQKTIYFLLPLFPIFIVFFIGCIAETNRAPFDLAEAIASDLVSLKITICWKLLLLDNQQGINFLVEPSETTCDPLI